MSLKYFNLKQFKLRNLAKEIIRTMTLKLGKLVLNTNSPQIKIFPQIKFVLIKIIVFVIFILRQLSKIIGRSLNFSNPRILEFYKI